MTTKPKDSRKTAPVMLVLDYEIYSLIYNIAKSKGLSIQELIRIIIADYLEENNLLTIKDVSK